MALTIIDPKTALIIIDLQMGIVGMAAAHSGAEVVQKSAMLADAFRQHGLPVVLVNVTGGAPGRAEQARPVGNFPPGFSDLVPELKQQPTDHTVTKRTWGAFTNTDLQAFLKTEQITQIVLAGVATSIGVESTARFAYELGFNITLAIDAMTDMRADAHANSIKNIFPRLGETGTAEEIIALLNSSRG